METKTICGIIAKDKPIKEVLRQTEKDGVTVSKIVYEVPYHKEYNPSKIKSFNLVRGKPLTKKDIENLSGSKFRMEQKRESQLLVYDIIGEYNTHKMYSTMGFIDNMTFK